MIRVVGQEAYLDTALRKMQEFLFVGGCHGMPRGERPEVKTKDPFNVDRMYELLHPFMEEIGLRKHIPVSKGLAKAKSKLDRDMPAGASAELRLFTLRHCAVYIPLHSLALCRLYPSSSFSGTVPFIHLFIPWLCAVYTPPLHSSALCRGMPAGAASAKGAERHEDEKLVDKICSEYADPLKKQRKRFNKFDQFPLKLCHAGATGIKLEDGTTHDFTLPVGFIHDKEKCGSSFQCAGRHWKRVIVPGRAS